MQRMLQNGGESTAQSRIYTHEIYNRISHRGRITYSATQLRTRYTETNNSPERCNLSGYPALFPEPFSAGAPAPACACLSRGAAGDSSPTVPSGPLSVGAAGRTV